MFWFRNTKEDLLWIWNVIVSLMLLDFSRLHSMYLLHSSLFYLLDFEFVKITSKNQDYTGRYTKKSITPCCSTPSSFFHAFHLISNHYVKEKFLIFIFSSSLVYQLFIVTILNHRIFRLNDFRIIISPTKELYTLWLQPNEDRRNQPKIIFSHSKIRKQTKIFIYFLLYWKGLNKNI